MFKSLYMYIPNDSIKNALQDFRPQDDYHIGEYSYTIVDMIMSFVITVFNGFMEVSHQVLAFITKTYDLGVKGVEWLNADVSVLDLMFGYALPLFLVLVLTKWIVEFADGVVPL